MKMTQATLSKLLKATYLAAVSFVGSLTTALASATTFSNITDLAWTSIGLFTLTAFGGAYGLAGWSGPKVNGANGP